MNTNPAIAERNVTIANKRLEGCTYKELSKEFGISKTQIHRVLSNDECRDIIETGTKQLISLVPKAIDNYYDFLHSDDDNYRYKASKDLLETTGIRASRTENPVIQQYFTQVNVSQIPPEVLQFMDRKADDVTDDPDIITVTPEPGPSNDKGLQGEGD